APELCPRCGSRPIHARCAAPPVRRPSDLPALTAPAAVDTRKTAISSEWLRWLSPAPARRVPGDGHSSCCADSPGRGRVGSLDTRLLTGRSLSASLPVAAQP